MIDGITSKTLGSVYKAAQKSFWEATTPIITVTPIIDSNHSNQFDVN